MMLDNQQAYEISRAHFLNVGIYGYSDLTGGCIYRSEDNPDCKCAIGVHIEDHMYDPDWDGDKGGGLRRIVEFNSYEDFGLAEKLAGCDFEFLVGMQAVHDNAANSGHPMDEFIRRLDAFAIDWNLTVPSHA